MTYSFESHQSDAMSGPSWDQAREMLAREQRAGREIAVVGLPELAGTWQPVGPVEVMFLSSDMLGTFYIRESSRPVSEKPDS